MYTRTNTNICTGQNFKRESKQPFMWKPSMSSRVGTDKNQPKETLFSSNQFQSENARQGFGMQSVQASTSGLNVAAATRFQTSNLQSAVSDSNHSLGLMGAPRPRAYSSSPANVAKEGQNLAKATGGRLTFRNVGETEQEKLCILTGTVERVIKYGKIFQNKFSYFQVFGSVVSIKVGKIPFENTMLLRDKKGPILQLIYYSNTTHINIEDFHLGQNLRAVGRMLGQNLMSANTIRAATEEELEVLPRMCYISDYSVSVLCGDGSTF